MHTLSSLVATLALLCATLAVSLKVPGTDTISEVTCGSNTYSRQQIDEATGEGCRLYYLGQTLGNSKYPHYFRNYENLALASSNSVQEFPILRSGNYTGKSPGTDRIVFDPNYRSEGCVFVGAMTHTDSRTRYGFVECDIVEGRANNQPSSSVTPSSSATSTPSSASSGPSPSESESGATRIAGLGVGSLSLALLALVL